MLLDTINDGNIAVCMLSVVYFLLCIIQTPVKLSFFFYSIVKNCGTHLFESVDWMPTVKNIHVTLLCQKLKYLFMSFFPQHFRFSKSI